MLGDCRKSPKVAILALSHVMKSDTYKHQNHKFRVFRQSVEISQNFQLSDMCRSIAVIASFCLNPWAQDLLALLNLMYGMVKLRKLVNVDEQFIRI